MKRCQFIIMFKDACRNYFDGPGIYCLQHEQAFNRIKPEIDKALKDKLCMHCGAASGEHRFSCDVPHKTRST